MTRGLALAALLSAGPLVAAEPPARHRGEFLQMWDAIVSGSMMGPGDGWFKPAQTPVHLGPAADQGRPRRRRADYLGRVRRSY